MKLLIVTLVGLSAECFHSQDPTDPPFDDNYTTEEALKAYFDIDEADVNKKCHKAEEDKKVRWERIEEALKALVKAANSSQAWDNDLQYPKDVIKTALPCAEKKERDEKLEFYKYLPI